MSLRAIDLFSGAGGLSLGLERAGFEVLGAVDSWSPAIRSYQLNFDHPILHRDASALTGAQIRSELSVDETTAVDLVVGGPPCQGFSIQRVGADHDERNSLVLEFGRLVRELAPSVFLMENVAGLNGRRGRPLLERLQSEMEDDGYEVAVVMVDARTFGVPQRRRRLLVYGWRSDCAPPELPPGSEISKAPTVWDAIGDLPPAAVSAEDADDPLHVESRMSDLNRRRLTMIPPGGGFEHLPPELRVACHRDGPEKIGHRNVYGRLAPDEPAVTITARFDSFTRGKFAHPKQHRNITLREGARLQTFPDDFKFVGTREEIAALIGNAVPPRMAAQVLAGIARQLSATASEPNIRSRSALGGG